MLVWFYADLVYSCNYSVASIPYYKTPTIQKHVVFQPENQVSINYNHEKGKWIEQQRETILVH